MTIGTTADLIAAVGRWLRRADLFGDIPTFIQLAEAQINRDLKLEQQIFQATISITGEFVTLPTGFRQERGLRLTSGSSRALDYIPPEQMNERKAVPAGYTAEPRHFTLGNQQFEFYPIPDKTYSALLTYQAGIPPLASNTTNWLLTDHPDVYLYGALLHSAPFLRADARIQTWGELFKNGLDEVGYALRPQFDTRLKTDPLLRVGARRQGLFNIITGDN